MDEQPTAKLMGHHYAGATKFNYISGTIFSINVLLSVPSIESLHIKSLK